MTYRVIIMPRADQDLRTIHQYIGRNAPLAAVKWLRRARQAASSLAHHPERCALAPESASFNEPIRQLLFGSGNRGTYRFLFIVVGQTVYILHVRHGSMLPVE